VPEISRFFGIVIKPGLVIEWATLHRQELHLDWERARAQQELQRIAPLE